MLGRVPRWLAVLALVAPTGVAVATATPAYATCAVNDRGGYPVLTGTLQLNAMPVSGARLVASGIGFKPFSPVCLDVASTPVQLTTAKANRDGNFSATLTLPDLSRGQHILRASGTSRGGSPLILNTAFTNGYTLPSTGVRLARWAMLGLAAMGLTVLLARRPSRVRS